MPHQAAFKGQYEYYATALHELGHATGHGSRMAREFGPFGSEVYAKEELRAEIASYMLTTELGLGHYPERHAAYVGSWMKAIKEDRNALFAAARDAENIRTWVMEPDMRQSLKPVKAKEQTQELAQPASLESPVQAMRKKLIETMFEKYPNANPTLWVDEIRGVFRLPDDAPGRDFRETLYASKVTEGELRPFLRNSAERANWYGTAMFVFAGMSQSAKEGSAMNRSFADAAKAFAKIDWYSDLGPTDDFRDKAQELIKTEALKSRTHQELASAVWDIDGPRTPNIAKPDWYIAPKERVEESLQRINKPIELKPMTSLQLEGPKNRIDTIAPRQEDKSMMQDPAQQLGGTDKAEHKRIYLNVPFSEKNQAKALGAKWDRHAKAWYARDDMDIKPFAQWTEAKAHNPAPKIRPEDEFAQALREHGLILEGPPTMDGKWHRVAVEGDRKGQQSGSYRGFLEGIPAGNITNHKSGQDPVKWVATGTKIDPKELEQAKAQAAARKATQEQELRAQYRAVAKRAYGIFQNAEPAPAHHAYLQNKQVPAGDLRIDQSGNLLMPVANEKGFVENIQTIHPDGTKMFLKDGKKRGLMHVIKGEPKGPMIITEGYSTGQSLHMATGLTVVVALDSGNLAPVAEALHRKHPDRPLVIAADDDHAKKVNAGLKGAERASELTGAKILRPDLSDAEKAKGLTDFNDIHRERGLEALKRLVSEPLGLTKPKAKTRTRGREQQTAGMAV